MKKGLLFLLGVFVSFAFAFSVDAAEVTVCSLPTCSYSTLKDAFTGAADGDTIKLMEDQLDMASRVVMAVGDTRSLTLDLNGFNVSMSKAPLVVYQGHLNITGSGTIEETALVFSGAQAAIVVGGSSDPAASNYSSVTVGENVVLKATYAGIFVSYHSSVGPHAYGLTVNVNGKIFITGNKADSTAGQSINITGNIKDVTGNVPVINVNSTSSFEVTYGPGIYAAGYANWNFNGPNIIGSDSALAIKSGNVVINGGTYKVTGPDSTPTTTNSNGMNASGAVIQLESNTRYAGNVGLTINDGVFESANGVVIYEYVDPAATDTSVSNVVIKDGTFKAAQNKNVFLLSTEFETKITGFVSGGTYNSDPSAYLAPNLVGNYVNGVFQVEQKTNTPVTDNPNTSDSVLVNATMLAICSIVILSVIGYKTKKSKIRYN